MPEGMTRQMGEHLMDAVDKLTSAINKIERAISAAPSGESQHEMNTRITVLEGDVKRLTASVEAQAKSNAALQLTDARSDVKWSQAGKVATAVLGVIIAAIGTWFFAKG